MTATGAVADVGRQMSSEISGAPSGPGTDRSSTVKAPCRRRSSFVGDGIAGFGCRSSGITSGVIEAGRTSASGARTAAHSGSNGGGGPISAACKAVGGDVSVTRTSMSGKRPGVTAITIVDAGAGWIERHVAGLRRGVYSATWREDGSGGDPAGPVGVSDERGPVAAAGLGQQVVDVGLHRGLRHEQPG